ncbi:MAG TPA: ABC transporter ATP-binding protein [Balneolales bacterium]|nr:ABC transporter ATP-binding protein [Balneolales bacterium]
MINISNLTKTYGKLEVLKAISLTIDSGKITAIVGPNGAGKTTIIKCVLGLITPNDGKISIDGKEISGNYKYRDRIGYMAQIARFPENLTVRNILNMVKDLRKGSYRKLDEELIKHFNLNGELGKKIKNLSGGNTQKVNATIAFLFSPDFLILDEPTASLDPIASSILKDKIKQEKESGKTVILSSHIMAEVEELADDIIFLLEGEIYYQGSLSGLIEVTRENNLERAIAKMMHSNEVE